MLPPRHRAAAASALAALDAAHPQLDGAWRDVAAELAARAGDRTRAGLLLIESGRESIRVGALATALGTLRRAADLLERDDRRSEAELLSIEALSLAGRVDEAAAVGNALLGRFGGDPALGRSGSKCTFVWRRPRWPPPAGPWHATNSTWRNGCSPSGHPP